MKLPRPTGNSHIDNLIRHIQDLSCFSDTDKIILTRRLEKPPTSLEIENARNELLYLEKMCSTPK